MVKKVIRMYQAGQYVRYRGNGVFRVQNIVSKRLRDGKEKQYYVLEGVFGMEMRITTPMDYPGLRELISKAEAEDVMIQVSQLEVEWPQDRRLRGEVFKTMLASNDWKKSLKVLKTIYCQKVIKERNHKQLTAEETEILDHTRRILTEELALTLALPLSSAKVRMTQIEQLSVDTCVDMAQ